MSQNLINRLKLQIRRYPLISFFLVSCIVSWGYWEFIVRPAGFIDERSMQIPFAWGPLLASLLVLKLSDNHIIEWIKQISRWRVHVLWYLLALLIPFIDLFVLLILALFGTPISFTEHSALEYPKRFFTTLLIAGSIEEFGWRGFLQPRLQKRYSALLSAVIVGLLWAVWHFPVVYFGGASYDPGDFFGFLIILPLWSIIMAWLYNSTRGALIIPMLFHAATNTPNPVRLAETASPTSGTIYELIVLGFWLLLPITLVLIYGKNRLAK